MSLNSGEYDPLGVHMAVCLVKEELVRKGRDIGSGIRNVKTAKRIFRPVPLPIREFDRPENRSDNKPAVPVRDKTEPSFADRTEHKEPKLQCVAERPMIEQPLLLPVARS